MRNELNWIFIGLCYLRATYLRYNLRSFIDKLDLTGAEDYEEAANARTTDLFS
jgi:hypothetical protein